MNFTDVLGDLANSAANVIGAINGSRGKNTQLAADSQEQARKLSSQQAAKNSSTKLLWIIGAALLGVLVLVFALRK